MVAISIPIEKIEYAFIVFLHKKGLILEDEYHATFICDKFKEIREIYLYSWFTGQPSRENLHSIFFKSNHFNNKKISRICDKVTGTNLICTLQSKDVLYVCMYCGPET